MAVAEAKQDTSKVVELPVAPRRRSRRRLIHTALFHVTHFNLGPPYAKRAARRCGGLTSRERDALAGGRPFGERKAGPPFGGRTDRPGSETTAAIGTDIGQHGLDAIGAEGAFIGADPRQL
jgi:hypothetical protein